MNTNMNSNGFKYCTNCRTRLPRQAVFCYKCSARQAIPQTPPPMNGRPMPNPGARPNPNPNPALNPPPKPELRKENANTPPPKYENVQDVKFREAPKPQPMPAPQPIPQPQPVEEAPSEKTGMSAGIIVAIALSVAAVAMFVAMVFAFNRESGFYYEYKNKHIDDDKEIVEEIDSFEWIDEYPEDDDFFDYFYDDYDPSWDNFQY